MREPAFWWRRPGLAARLLAPAGLVCGAVAGRRLEQSGHRVAVPVICVGNLTVGGAGKTPTAIAIAELLRQSGKRPFILSRGYGGSELGPLRVDPKLHRARDVGDEALLLARAAPVIVGADRVADAMLARSEGADVLVMDDGFQNPALEKDLSIVVIDGRRGVGNGAVIPAGPLRAPLSVQLDRAQAILVIAADSAADDVLAQARARGLPIFHGHLAPDPAALKPFANRRVLAFAGIGDPGKFFATLTSAGVKVAERRPFPDHHPYTLVEATELARHASRGLVLATTEKDLVKLTGEPALVALAKVAHAVPVKLVIEEQAAFQDLILGAARRVKA